MFATAAATAFAPAAPRRAEPEFAANESAFGLEALLAGLPLVRRTVQAREVLFHAGQPLDTLYFVHAGCFRTGVVSEDGREKITGFRMRGDLLGLDALGTPAHGCDAVALDTGEVWELPRAALARLELQAPGLRDRLTEALAQEVRRNWQWMLSLGTLNAEQRVATFLLELAGRQHGLGYSSRDLMLRMTRADIGNFLALQLETVTRVLTRLSAAGVIEVDRRDIRLRNPAALRERVAVGV